MFKEVAPGIFKIVQKKRSRLAAFSVNVYVIAGKDGLVFDSGMGDRKSGAYLARQVRHIEETMRERGEACSITRVLPSHGHWDHFSGVEGLRERLGLRVLATPKMRPHMRSRRLYRKSFRKEIRFEAKPDPWPIRILQGFARNLVSDFFMFVYGVRFVNEPMEMVEEGASLTIHGEAWEIHGVPGHCDDDIVLFNRERGILFCGDIVLRVINTWIGPPRSNLDLYMKALDTLRSFPGLKLILPSHGSPITDPYTRLDQAIAHRHKRRDEVIGIVEKAGGRGIDFDRIMDMIYPGQNVTERFIAHGWVYLTLQSLMETHVVETSIRQNRLYFRMAGSL